MKYSNEVIFCVKYLKDKGMLKESYVKDILQQVDSLDTDYKIVEAPKDFWHELAEALRPLWPPGDKDGKWAWRDSVNDLSRRLETLWSVRNLGEYSIDTCVEVARQYLSRYETNAKYMQVLKYFVLKQKKIVLPDGKVKYINQSVFADMLENATDDVRNQAEWNELLENATVGEGRLV